MAKARRTKVRVLSAQAGTLRGGRFVATKRKNIAAGFHDDEGIFHPIRASFDYDPSRGGDKARKGKPRKKKAAKKAAAKPARKRKRATPVKKAKARKKRSR